MIAAGALAALIGQAWWQGRQDREREGDYLRQLLADTRENEDRVNRAISDDSAAGAAARRIAAFVYGTGPTPPSDSMVRWFLDRGAFSSSEFQPLTGSYAALLTTGDLRLIRDEALRNELVAYSTHVDAERENLRFFAQQAFGDAGRIARAFPFVRGMFSGDNDEIRLEAQRFPFARLRGDADVAAILFSLQAANSNRLGHLRGLRYGTQRLRGLLETQKAGRKLAPDTTAAK